MTDSNLPSNRVHAAMVSRAPRAGLAAVAAALGLVGCAAAPAPDGEAAGVYCYRYNRSLPDKARFRTCTSGDVPRPEVDAEAKRFAPVADAATVYVVRHSPGDTDHRLVVSINGLTKAETKAETVPRSLVRVRLPPGEYRLDFAWHGIRNTQPLQLRAGDVRFVALEATAWLGWCAIRLGTAQRRVRARQGHRQPPGGGSRSAMIGHFARESIMAVDGVLLATERACRRAHWQGAIRLQLLDLGSEPFDLQLRESVIALLYDAHPKHAARHSGQRRPRPRTRAIPRHTACFPSSRRTVLGVAPRACSAPRIAVRCLPTQ